MGRQTCTDEKVRREGDVGRATYANKSIYDLSLIPLIREVAEGGSQTQAIHMYRLARCAIHCPVEPTSRFVSALEKLCRLIP
jgi:hypothetical protein